MTLPAGAVVAAMVGVAAATACTDGGLATEPFPVPVSVASGPVLVEVQEGVDGPVRLAVLDLLSPLTILDAPVDAAPVRRTVDLALVADLGDGTRVPRARVSPTVFELHACTDDPGSTRPTDVPCRVGPGGAPVEVGAILGADAFARAAIRFDLPASTVAVFADVAGDNGARGRLCEGVLTSPFEGGGTITIGDTDVPIELAPRRIALNVCLGHELDVDPDAVTTEGADGLLVLSTGVGPTLLSTSAYERWRQAGGGTAPAAADLPAGSVWLPSGLLTGGVGRIDRLAIVGGDQEVRGPCRQVSAHKLLTARDCASGDDCPCRDSASFCRIPAVVELVPDAGLEVLVVADEDLKTIQALRFGLGPETADPDGILGASALAATSFDVDPIHDRVLLRCEAAGCRVRPELITRDQRALVGECLAREIGVDPDVPSREPL